MSLLNYIGTLDEQIGAPVVPPPLARRTDRRSSSPGGGAPAGGGPLYYPGQGYGPPGGYSQHPPAPPYGAAPPYANQYGMQPYAPQAYGQYGPSPQELAIMYATQAMREKNAAAARMLTPIAPGVPQNGWREEPLGFANFVFTATSGTLLQQLAQPQRPFKGRRLVIDIARTGASATGLVTVNAILVGSTNVLVSAQSIPASMFAGNSWGVDLNIPEATPGVLLTLQLAISLAPTMTDTVVCSAGIIGLSWS